MAFLETARTQSFERFVLSPRSASTTCWCSAWLPSTKENTSSTPLIVFLTRHVFLQSCACCPTGFIANKGHENEQLRSEVGVRWCEHRFHIHACVLTHTNSFPGANIIYTTAKNGWEMYLLAYILLVAIGSSIDIFHANPSLLQGGSFYDTFIESKFSCFSRQGGHSK